MNSVPSHLIVASLGIGLNALATFRLPETKLMQDPVDTLASAVPILLLGYCQLLILSLCLRGASVHDAMFTTGRALLTTGCATLVLHLLTILFGAPLLAKFYNTLVFSAYLAILSIFPAFIAIVTPGKPSGWSKIFLQHCPTTTSEIYGYTQAVCTFSGAWIGAIVLPLDWDREWQAWPISCVISTFLGHAVGVVAGFCWSFFKQIYDKPKTE
ncbi:GPI biosynthesis protein Pig-F [Phycomyces nitens]|nr:GPI biosynthesis protein Pig-F [Phycomyces nitens]